ncbi:hypothetical protein BBK36DRAFT_1110590 [Trichoderma citrinoviride]|uniref:Tautomerase cis-CaaD-like domain-containing protein n=1 Tax=Trichoderma citrinoviride TaxID=58853 RepID=A0A2T4BIZ7_9HYPO|nr:hypothetical protein BBK36DRAFT_1110590 [Trichoderma citrinoviride]PTB69292.1 hypothetical protein BBK36DRAFT_1110590 [Trichoderma citrinoviride]
MPLWLIYHPPTAYTDPSAKDALVKTITSVYTTFGLPAFYVVVNFIQVPLENTYIGGVTRSASDRPFVRLAADHIAHNFPRDDDKAIRAAGNTFRDVLAPRMAELGYDWEFHIAETDRRLWKINGLTPPERETEGERLWIEVNKPVPYE